MKLFKLSSLAAALLSLALPATALTAIDDEDLSKVSGQDGVSALLNLNITPGSWQFTDSNYGGSMSFNGVSLRGMMPLTMDILDYDSYVAVATAAVVEHGKGSISTTSARDFVAAMSGALGLQAGQKVVQLTVPAIDDATQATIAPSLSIGSVTLGQSTTSFGAVALNNIDARGTHIWTWSR